MLGYFIAGFLLAITFSFLTGTIVKMYFKKHSKNSTQKDVTDVLASMLMTAFFVLIAWPVAVPIWILLALICVFISKSYPDQKI